MYTVTSNTDICFDFQDVKVEYFFVGVAPKNWVTRILLGFLRFELKCMWIEEGESSDTIRLSGTIQATGEGLDLPQFTAEDVDVKEAKYG